MQCELALIDRKHDSDGNKVYSKRKSQEEDGKHDWWKLYALTETRHFKKNGHFKRTRLHVNPQSLKQLLQDVVVDFPFEPIDAQQDVELDLPAYCLFFFRNELESIGLERFKDDEKSLGYLELLLGWIDKELEDSFKASQRFQNSEFSPISYEYLWTVFKPGCLVFTRILGQPRAFKLHGFWYEDDQEPCLALKVKFIDYDGEKFGWRYDTFRIPKYAGTMLCKNLNVMPLNFHPSAAEIRTQLLERGRRFQQMTGQHFKDYSGVAVKRIAGIEKYDRFNFTGRVAIDAKTYSQFEAGDMFELEELDRTEAAKRQRTLRKYNEGIDKSDDIFDALLEEDLMVANSVVRGFSFNHREFMEFFVDNLSPVAWDETCFEQLVLDPVPKRTLQALVSMHTRRNQNTPDGFDDIIKGKGKGLVMVLHGPPGVGKTLTAECVAESVHRPLYMVSAGDLGTDSWNLELKLKRIMDIATAWKAVLLIDEADVFLERRSLNDMQRNAMVSVFLRVLEYYQGILFLTTNRVGTFDDAFASRIHVPLRYSNLSETSRRTIWRNFCNRVTGGVDISEEELDALAKHELNGRQIKNIVKAAESLAAFDGRKLDAAQLESFTKVQGEFERDWLGFVDIDA
ncbi:P-loop containing nucleoside triphosphate hydrolase protein [Whalleya microplaca]|nr:P-loop containing nucleoside triphosphate hydrolase protein [Whalleya microplaca]